LKKQSEVVDGDSKEVLVTYGGENPGESVLVFSRENEMASEE
jgi:hypothetical protein